ncbi:hypothetical protein EW145_g2767 [Phellinidium pouzarii]|uniref:BTB domain-containing protein n=1 Tax=Phellinidium pouzarii TaxID=167371 RepID=A0A4S4L9V5_9AGAM|nr:hypothetical protein EW145_g2767 [Phellinidium pouzarii]
MNAAISTEPASATAMMLPSADVLKHVIDVHCHPTDSETPKNLMDELPITVCAMATRHDDQALVAELANAYPDKVVPCFGYHPWFSHWISITPMTKKTHYHSLFLSSADMNHDSANQKLALALEEMLPSLPDPISLEDCIATLRKNFGAFPRAMLGEIGLDRLARVPYDYRAEQRKLSPFTIPFEHQLSVVEAQLALAVEMRRNVSFHSVKSQKATIDLLEHMKNTFGQAWTQISVDLHSCGLSSETWRDIEKSHVNVYLSLSMIINGRSPAYRKLITMASSDRLLVESDIHEIGQCATRTWDMLLMVAEIKGWIVEDQWDDEGSQVGVVHKLEHNWKAFLKGGHNSSVQYIGVSIVATMSRREPTSSSTSTNADKLPADNFHADFCSQTADFVVRSCDGISFKCHRLFLQESSPVFRTMLTLPQPGASVSTESIVKPPSIDLPEDSNTLAILLRIIYPMVQPVIESIGALTVAFFAAEKYDMAGVISTLRLHLRDDRFLSESPVHVFALACRFHFAAEAKTASRATLAADVHDPKNAEMFMQTGFKVADLISLHSLRHRRIDRMREFLDCPDRFEGNSPDFACISCEKKLNDITWPLLKASILKELYWRPLGDTIFAPDFLKSNAVQSFINSKCEECQERLIYEKGKTLAMICEFLKSLPDSIDISTTCSS